MRTREKRNVAFLLAVLIFIHGLPLQPMDVYAQNEQETWIELKLTDNASPVANAKVEVKFLEEWITLTYDYNKEVYQGCYQGNTVSGNLLEKKYDVKVVADGYSSVEESIEFSIVDGIYLSGSLDIQYNRQPIAQDKITLKGSVNDMRRLPLSGVKVTIIGEGDNAIYKFVMTGEDGSYEFELVRGFYSIIFEKEDYGKIEKKCVIEDNMDVGIQFMKKITTYELTVSVIGAAYGSIDVYTVSENKDLIKKSADSINETVNGKIYTYKCNESEKIKISANVQEDAFLTEKTEKKMKSENAGEGKVDDGSSYYYMIESMDESEKFEIEFEPASYGLIRYEGGRVTYLRNGKGGKIFFQNNLCTISPDIQEHYCIMTPPIMSNENNVVQIAPNQYEFLGSGSEFLKIEYEKDEILSQITLSGNGICQEGEQWFWFLDEDSEKRLFVQLKESQRKVKELRLNFGQKVVDVVKDGSEDVSNYVVNISDELLDGSDKIYIKGIYQEACLESDCKYCTINEEISTIRDNIPPKVEDVLINDKETSIFEQDGVTYINEGQVVINAVISDNYNVQEIYYKCYEEKKEPAEIKADYDSGKLQSVRIDSTNILEKTEKNNNTIYKIKCSIDTKEAATGMWYLYVVAKDYAGNINFGNEDYKTFFLKFGKDTEPPTVSINEIGENKSGSNFKKKDDVISLEGVFKDEHTWDGLEYYVTEPIRINSHEYDPEVWGELEENAKWIKLEKNSNDQTGNRNVKKRNLYISNGQIVLDNDSIPGNGLEEGSYIVWLYAKDGCGNKSKGASYVFHIDDTAPHLDYLRFVEKKELYNKFLSFGNFFSSLTGNNNKTITIEALGEDAEDELYFEFDREKRELKSIKPEIEEIRLFYKEGSSEDTATNSISDNNALWESGDFIVLTNKPDTDNEYISDFKMPKEAVFYQLRAVAKDKSGNFGECNLMTNKTYRSNLVMWDQTCPYISDSFKPQQKTAYKNWYRANSIITYQFETGDKESGLSRIVLKVNGIDLEMKDKILDLNSKEMKKELFCNLSIQTDNIYTAEADTTITYNITDDKNDKEKIQYGDKSCVSIASDGHVTIACEATDNAGNTKNRESTIYIDQDKPVLSSITFTVHNNRIKDELAVVPEQYGYFFKQRTEVTVYATDFIGTSQNVGSGVEAFIYYFKHSNGAKTTPRETAAIKGQNGIYSAKFSVPENFKGQIFVQAVDKTGQKSDNKTPKGIIIDNLKEHRQHSKAEIVLPETSYKDGEGNPLYNYLPVIEFKTADKKSGIKENAWSIKPFHLSENEADGVLKAASVYNKDAKAFVPKLSGDTEWKIPGGLDLNLITEANKKYQIKNQMNHMEAKLKLTDNAGNSLKETVSVFSVDTTNPEIKVEYSNNNVLHEKYYKEPRTATITITERNFSEEGVELLITGDGVKKGEWQHHAGGGCNEIVHTDSCNYTCDVVFDEDGEYTLLVNCTDLAGNKGTYGQTDEFVIDMTAPVVMVTYDNNNAKNGRYYKEGRVGTIDIEEVNFDEEETIVTVTAKRQAEAIEVPAIPAFLQNEYHHRATVSYEQDGDYTFDIKVTDLAGNEAEIFTSEEFTIDTTPPELLVEGVKDGSANKGVVAPVITYEDINLEEDSVSIILTGANLGKVKYEQKVVKTENGKKISLGDFKHKKEMDDLYTLKTVVQDLAGNETIDEKTFSVNRFGSVYVLDDSTKELVEGFYSNKERDLVITEINVDSLQFQEIVASMDGEMTTLKEGRDFEIKESISDSSWKAYEYHIGAGNFKEEGAYVVTIYSEDRAENKSSNKAKGKELEFIIDKTPPSIVVAGIEDGGQYNQVSREISLDIQDNILLKDVEVYVDGKVIRTTDQKELIESDGIVKLSLKGANRKQILTVISRDAAGNQAVSPELKFLITKNLFVQWYSNKMLFYGSMIGVAAVIMLMFWLRKRRDSKIN